MRPVRRPLLPGQGCGCEAGSRSSGFRTCLDILSWVGLVLEAFVRELTTGCDSHRSASQVFPGPVSDVAQRDRCPDSPADGKADRDDLRGVVKVHGCASLHMLVACRARYIAPSGFGASFKPMIGERPVGPAP